MSNYFSSMNSGRVIKMIWIGLLIAGCNSKAKEAAWDNDYKLSVVEQSGKSYRGVVINIEKTVYCNYPKNDPVYEKKKNKKLLLFNMSVLKNETGRSEAIIPAGAVVADSRGNLYETSPGVIAMAQSSRCIKGDDIKAYNNIWNGTIHTGEIQKAFVLGFELPADVLPVKLYWNKHWVDEQFFFELNTDTITKN
jgi:hypothetical protein